MASCVQEVFKKCGPWMRLSICVNIHIKEALISVVHNNINDPQLKAIPSDPADLYKFLQTHKRKIQKSTFIKSHQKSILLPTNSQSVESASLDISLLRFLIQTFCGIKNAKGDWKEPAPTDLTLCAFVFRAADLRNRICHNNDVDKMDEPTFEKIWKELMVILQGLKYTENLEDFKTETMEFEKLKSVILEEFVGHLRSYKEECTKEPTQDDYIQRRFYFNEDKNIIPESDVESLIEENDCLMIYGEAGVGKSSTARRIKNKWCKETILKKFDLIYFDSKKINKLVKVDSNAAPLYFSDLGVHLKKNGWTADDLSVYSCVKKTIEKLIILIDGIDEFPVRDIVTGNYVDELEGKVMNNEKINAADTINAIYFGFLLPNTKICVLGRNNEFERLKEFISRNTHRKINDLKLLEFDDENVKDFTCNKICNRQQNGQTMCIGACKKIYEEIKTIKLCKIPTDLSSLIELYKTRPNENIGSITRTKLIITTLLKRLTKHIYQNSYLTFKSFRKISEKKDFNNYLECIRILGKISFNTLLEDNITVKVEEKQGDFIYKKEIKVERKIFEELDLFYVRDFDYYSILEPYHTLNIEFLTACYLLSHPDELDSIMKLYEDRQLVIISFIAGLHADDYFTKDFVENVLNTSIYSLEQFFSWLCNVEDIRESLPSDLKICWFGLMEDQKLSPSFFLLDSISNEVEIPQTLIPKSIVCYCYDFLSFEWYFMDYLKHNFLTKLSDKLNIELFLDKFPQYDFIIKGNIWISNTDEFNLLNKFGNNNRITFRINQLIISTSLATSFSCNFNSNTLEIRRKCDSRTIDMILNALSPPPTNTSSSNPQPSINCKQLSIWNISHFNSQQTEKLFELGLGGVVDNIVLESTFFTDGQLTILKNAEHKTNKMLNIELNEEELNDMFDLPNLTNRHVSLLFLEDVITDNDLIKLREHISTGYSNNFDKYKLFDPYKPFVRKQNSSQDSKQSMYLDLCQADFSEVSDEEFAKTFSQIPSLSCWDKQRYEDRDIYPASHWSSLSRTKECRINEMRIWKPQPKNFEHFLNITTNLLQLVCGSKAELKVLLNHIVTNPNIQLHKHIKVFVVKVDVYDWDYYAEIPVFSKKKIEEYKINYCSYDSLLDNFMVPFYEGELHLKWCCEISLPNIDSITIVSARNNERISIVSDDKMTSTCCCCR